MHNTQKQAILNDILNIVLQKMCSYVGVNIDDINTKEQFWFEAYEWTSEQEEDFRKWLSKTLYENKRIRDVLLWYPKKDSARKTRTAYYSFSP